MTEAEKERLYDICYRSKYNGRITQEDQTFLFRVFEEDKASYVEIQEKAAAQAVEDRKMPVIKNNETPPKPRGGPYFIAVRHTIGGGDWFDIHAASGDREEAERKANLLDAQIPDWAKANPVVRYARVNISEIET